jgi:hypothetical protein
MVRTHRKPVSLGLGPARRSVIRERVEGDGLVVEIEHGEPRPHPQVTRVTDRPRVHEPPPGVESDGSRTASELTARTVGKRAMRVTENDDACVGSIFLELGELARGLNDVHDVLLGIVETSVCEDDTPFHLRVERKRLEVRADIVAKHTGGPAQSRTGNRVGPSRTKPPDRDQIVVARDCDRVQASNDVDALVRERPVTHQIAGDQITVDTVVVQP